MGNIGFNSRAFVQSLAVLGSVVAQKSPIPAFSNVCITVASGDSCQMLASDGDMWLSVRTPLLYGEVGMCFCVDALDFLKVLRNLDDVSVELRVDSDASTLTCVHPTGHFTLPCFDGREFPKPLDLSDDLVGDEMMRLSDFGRVVDSVRFCTANETLRPVLNGVFVVFNQNGLLAVATDGNRLARRIDASVAVSGDFSFILPKKAITALLALASDGDVHIRLDGKAVEFECYDFKMCARLIEGRYPNFASVIPTDDGNPIELDRNRLVASLRRVMPFGNSESQLVVLTFTDGELAVETRDDDFNKSGREQMPCTYKGDSLSIGFKNSSLIDVVSNVQGDTVTMELWDATHSSVIHGGNRGEYLSLLMPMLL